MKTIETIKQMITDGQISQEVAEKYFPELRENKDVRMKNFISNELACLRALDEKGTVRYNELTEAMAWFEKQTKQETLCDKCKKAQPSHSCQDITALGRCAVEHEQKSTDKIEPKFHEGEWVFIEEIKGYKQGAFQIKSVDEFGYNFNEYHIIPFKYEELLSKWNIEDAKDGDMLYSIRVNAIILYKYRSSDGIHINAYCALQKGIFIKQEMLWDRDFVPATKEQRDLLFQKMKEAGYEWDAEKKKLKKLEKSTWSEEDERLFQIVIDILDRQNHLGNISRTDLIACVRKLKSLIPQPKQEWSEEDEDLLKCTINNLTEIEQSFGKDYGKVGKCINWIKQKRWKKSLKTADLENSLCDVQDGYSDTSYEYRVLGEAIEFIRSTDDPHAWRPSEEQITWLYRAADDASKDSRMKQILNELLSDLKKLREG